MVEIVFRKGPVFIFVPYEGVNYNLWPRHQISLVNSYSNPTASKIQCNKKNPLVVALVVSGQSTVNTQMNKIQEGQTNQIGDNSQNRLGSDV